MQKHLAFSICLATALLAFGPPRTSSAQTASVPDPAQLVEALREKSATRGVKPPGQTPMSPDRKTERARLIADLKTKATRGLSVQERTQLAEVAAERPAVDLEVYFDLNSAEISPRAEPTLRALGTALKDPQISGKTVLLAGHTDATGPKPYNQSLSERRAQAVRAYLVKNFGLSEAALLSVGYGPERLKLPDAPFAGENRRVEVVNLGD